MARLPTPGSDAGNWGEILNDFLRQSLHDNGALKSTAISSAIGADAITESQLDAAVRTKLNTASGAAPTNLTQSATAATVTIASDTGTDATLTAATPTTAGVLTAADKSKLDAIASGATANAPDAALLDRANHTGTQSSASIVDFSSAVDTRISAATASVVQPYHDDLVDIAGLTPTDDDVLQRKAGSWTHRTPAQLKLDLALVKADVGLANVDNTADSSKSFAASQITSGTLDVARLAPGTTLTVMKSGGVWPARPTDRADIVVIWKGDDPSPPIVSSGTGGMLDNVDMRFVTG